MNVSSANENREWLMISNEMSHATKIYLFPNLQSIVHYNQSLIGSVK